MPCLDRRGRKKPKPTTLSCTYAKMAASLAPTALCGPAGGSLRGARGLAARGRAPASCVSAAGLRVRSHAARANASSSSKVRPPPRLVHHSLARSCPSPTLSVESSMRRAKDASHLHAAPLATKEVVGNLTFFFFSHPPLLHPQVLSSSTRRRGAFPLCAVAGEDLVVADAAGLLDRIAQDVDCIVMDCDGVIWQGGKLLPGRAVCTR